MKEYIDNIEEIRNIRANYEPMDIDYIDKMGEEKTITNAQEYDILYYIVHLQKEIQRLKEENRFQMKLIGKMNENNDRLQAQISKAIDLLEEARENIDLPWYDRQHLIERTINKLRGEDNE